MGCIPDDIVVTGDVSWQKLHFLEHITGAIGSLQIVLSHWSYKSEQTEKLKKKKTKKIN